MKDRRRLTRIAGAVLLLASFWSCGEGERNWRTITVTSPNGSETLVAGSTVAVTWSTIGEVGNVTIELSTDGGSSWTVLVPSTDNDGEEYVVLPYTPGTECLIRVGETDGDPSDASNAEFEIAAAPISLAWAKRAGGTDWDGGTGVAVLPDGSVFVIGHFDETVMFGSGEANETALTSTSSYRDAFLARYDPNGELVWARSDPAQSCGVSVLTDGSAFVTGHFGGTRTFGQGEGNETVVASTGVSDIHLARYNPDGTLAWVRRAGGAGSDWGQGVAVLPDGSAFVTGYFEEAAAFGQGEANETVLTSVDSADLFLARYNPDGTLAWVRTDGGVDWDQGRGIGVLVDGSSLVTGNFSGTATFGRGEANETVLASAGNSDVFLACYGPDGTLAWATRAGGTNLDRGVGLAVLSDGSAFVTGYFAGTATFGQGETNETVLTCAGIFDVFLARYDSEGALVWARRAGGTGDQSAVGVAALSDGSAFITGAFRLMMILGPGEANETTLASEGYDAFLARYNPDGTLAWATSTSGTYCWSSDVAALSDGSVFMAGRSQAAVTFGEGEVNETAFPREGLFLARYNSDATLAWAKCFGNGCEEKAGVSAVLTDGSVLLTGWFQGTVTFGPGEANETALTATGGSDVFLARYNPDGTLGWARRDGGTGEDSGHGVAVLPDGSTFVAGSFWGSAIFGAGDANETILVSAVGNPDVFLARYDADGTLAWATRAGGASFDQGSRVAALSDGSTLVTGFFRGPATFGPGEVNETILTSSGNNDVFLARYDPDGALAWVVHGGGSNNDFPEGLALLSDGSAFVTGCFRETATFGPGEANETVLTSAGDKDVFLARYNPDGSLAWAAQAGGADRDEGLGLAVLPDGTAFVTGYFRGVATFGLGGANETVLDAGVYGDAFLACYNANGTLGWAVSTGHEGYATGYGVAVLADASALVTGRFGETVSFGHGDPNETALTSVGSDDIFLARYNADGTLDAVVRAGGTGSESGGNVAALPDGSALVTGSFRGVATFGPGELNETTLTGAGTPDIFVARYDP